MSRAARSMKNQPPQLDPSLQNKLVAKFGKKLMKQGFTALPVLAQKYYRYVPGNVFPHEVVDAETGEVSIVERISYMTPTEYALMTAIWSFWWTDQSNPWPAVEQICKQTKKSERQVRRYLQRLRDKGFLLSLEQYNGEGKQISNRYDFSPFLKRLIAYLDALELREKRVQDTSRDDTSDRERMTDEAGRGCQNRQGIEDESDPESPDEENSDSSGSAADAKETVLGFSMGTCSHIAHGTIRSTEEDTNGTEGTNNVESNRTSNPSVTEKEMRGAARVKGVERASDSKKLTPFERTALKAGVPMDLVDALQTWYQACPRPEKHPMFLEGIVSTFSQELGNMAYLQSNLTQATKLYQYAQLKGFGEDDFRVWLYDAEKRTHRDGISNKMAYFFTALKIELLLAIAGSQWPQPPEPDTHRTDGAQMTTDDRVEEETASEESQEALYDGLCDGREELSPSVHSEASQPSEGETERMPIPLYPMLACDDPGLGWRSWGDAQWWADRLRNQLGENRYQFEIGVTEHGTWGFTFFERGATTGEAFLTAAAVKHCLYHGWQPPVQEQS